VAHCAVGHWSGIGAERTWAARERVASDAKLTRRRGLPRRWNEAGNAGICQVPGGHVEPAAHVRNGNAYRHAESDMEPARDDEKPDDDAALITTCCLSNVIFCTE
jgi:hypothetical protein